MEDLSKLRPIQVLPSVYDDSLSYYEVLNKIILAIQELDERVKALEEKMK